MRRQVKWLSLGILLAFAFPGLADDRCEAACNEVALKCEATCKKAIKKGKTDRVAVCQEKCKLFEDDCKSDCKAEKK